MKKKVWEVQVKYNPNKVQQIENDNFYTTDTEAYLIFQLIDIGFYPESAVITLENHNDGSLKNETVEVRDGLIKWEMPERYIEHFGNWQVQIVYEIKEGGQIEKYTSGVMSFNVNSHIGDKKKPSLVEIENWEKFIREGTELIETWEDLEALREENERQRQANYQELLDTGVLQTNINTKLEALEEEYAPKLTEVTAQLAHAASYLPKYVASRGQNLVTNGTGLMKDNTNFSAFTFEDIDAYNASGSFTNNRFWAEVFIDEFIPVNPDEIYRMTYYIKADPHVGDSAYGMVACYDADDNQIMSQHTMYVSGTSTQLAQDLKPGDTKIYLNDASNWNNGTTGRRGLIAWNYQNSSGYRYPPRTYSRNVWPGYPKALWDIGAVNLAENSITLREAWTGPSIPANTEVNNANLSGTYKYIAGENFIMPEQWERYTGTIGVVDMTGRNQTNSFHPGTASIKIGWILNTNTSGSKAWLSNISFGLDLATNKQIAKLEKAIIALGGTI